jgi:hypothetical protein
VRGVARSDELSFSNVCFQNLVFKSVFHKLVVNICFQYYVFKSVVSERLFLKVCFHTCVFKGLAPEVCAQKIVFKSLFPNVCVQQLVSTVCFKSLFSKVGVARSDELSSQQCTRKHIPQSRK